MDPKESFLKVANDLKTASNQEQIDLAQQEVDSIIEQFGVQCFHIAYEIFVEFPDKRENMIAFISIFCNKMFSQLDEAEQAQAIDGIFEIAKVEDLSDSFKDRLASLFFKMYNLTSQNWEELLERALTFDDIFCCIIINGAANDLEDIIDPYLPTILPKCVHLYQETHFTFVSAIATIFYYACDQESCAEFMPFFVEVAENGAANLSSMDENQQMSVWMIISGLFAKGFINLSEFNNYLSIVNDIVESQPEFAIKILGELADCIKILDQENLELLIQCSLSACISFMRQSDGELSSDALNVISEAIQTRKNGKSLVEQASELLGSDDPYEKSLGIRIFGTAIFTDSSAIRLQADEAKNIFVEILTSEDVEDMVKMNALFALLEFDDLSIELTSIIGDLVRAVLPLILSESDEMRQLAYQVLIQIIDSSDTEIEGLFGDVWEVMGDIPEKDFVEYITFVAKILGLSKDLDDEVVDQLYEWIDELTDEEKDVSIRCAALSVIANLMKQQNSVVDELVELANSLCQLAFEDTNDDIKCDALNFLQTTIEFFRAQAVDLVQPYIPTLFEMLNSADGVTRIVEKSLVTLANYIGYADSTQDDLIDMCVEKVRMVLKSEDTSEMQTAIPCIKRISRGLTFDPENEERDQHMCEYLAEFFDTLTRIICEFEEFQVINVAFASLKTVYKRGIEFNGELFMSKAATFIQSFLAGELKCLDNTPPKDSPVASNISDLACDFIGKVLESNIPFANEICQGLIDWLSASNDDELVYPIVGALSEAVDYCTLDEAIPQHLCEYFIENIESIDDPDVQHNIVYFLHVILRKYPNLFEAVQHLRPYVEQWYAKALEKESGYQEFISNVVSFWLSYALIDTSLPEEVLVQSLRRFPPADVKETETQCILMQKIFETPKSENLMAEAAVALSKLLTEPQGKLEKRAINAECYENTVQLFRNLCSNEAIAQIVVSKYDKSRQKQEIIVNILSQ